ncbi:MAG: chromate transporter [Eubacterium sp.]
MIYIKLFLSFLQIGLFSFGGGYAALPLIQNEVVTQNQWISMTEFTDLITISQMTPGPIAINAATFVGIKIAGVGGALAATAGCVLPSCVIVLILAKLYFKYRNMSAMQDILKSLRPAVVAMIASAGVSVLITAFWGSEVVLSATNWVLIIIFTVCVILLRKTKLNPVWVMLLAGVLNTVYAYIVK